MRFLTRDSSGRFVLTKHFSQDQLPEYAILSHTWRADDTEEVTFKDLKHGNAEALKPLGYEKIRFCGEQASRDGLKYFWMDTCCINRSNSNELQEAITTMFSWYQMAVKCYAYLTDVSASGAICGLDKVSYLMTPEIVAFKASKWFTRGWTLQELLAPQCVEFFSVEGTRLGDKVSLKGLIQDITGIPERALLGEDLSNFSIHERLSWAENRETKRREDEAYCLLGIFNIFMPLIYGEGSNAFNRLHDEIMRKNSRSTQRDATLSTLPHAPEAAFDSVTNQFHPVCFPNTQKDLLNTIHQWCVGHDESSMFWLNGMAGTGKSTVARTIAKMCHDENILGGSFFFSRAGGIQSNAKMLVTTLARQLAVRMPSTKRHVCDAIRANKDIASLSLRQQWKELILDPISKVKRRNSSSPIVLVIDAIDECDSDRDIYIILKMLAATGSLKSNKLRILTTSRSDIALRHGFGKGPKLDHSRIALYTISPDLQTEDLSLVFHKTLLDIDRGRGDAQDFTTVQTIQRLVEISCGLYIWASMACRFIMGDSVFDERRIGMLISENLYPQDPERQMDQIYTCILRECLEQCEANTENLSQALRDIVGSIAILSTPLSIRSLSILVRKPMFIVRNILHKLQAIFRIPRGEESHPVILHHASFRDFLLDQSRCTDPKLKIDQAEMHKSLADGCIEIMSRKLKQNICGLSSPGTLAEEVSPTMIERHIPPELEYACLYWAHHYRHSGTVLTDDDHVHRFLQEHFLHWLEAMSLMKQSNKMAPIIRMYSSLLVPSHNARQQPFVKEARMFTWAYQSTIREAPLQTYCAALVFISPANRRLGHHFQPQRNSCIRNITVAEADIPKAKMEYNYFNDLSFTPDGTQIASGSNNEVVRLWDVTSKSPIGKFAELTDKVSSVAISPDGMRIAAGSDDFNIRVWDLRTKSQRYTINAHSRWVNSVIFSPNGKILASGSMDETFALWDAETGEELKRINNCKSCVNSVAFSPDGSLIATGSVDEVVRLWDISADSDELLTIFDGHFASINSVKFSPMGNEIVSGSDDMTIKLWNITTGAESMTLKGHTGGVMAVSFSPNGHIIVSGSEDRTVRIWDSYNGTQLKSLTGHMSGINAVTFSPNGDLLASGSFDDEVRIWDTSTWRSHGPLDDYEDEYDSSDPGSPAEMEHVLFGSTIIENAEFKGHSKRVNCLVFSPNGQFLASGSEDSTIKLWIKDGTESRDLFGHLNAVNHLSFSPDSYLLASASADKTARLWSTATGAMLYTLEGHTGGILSVMFSANGRLLASCSTDATIKLWDAGTGRIVHTFPGHSGVINNMVFSPDNRLIASCSVDMTIRVWDLEHVESSVTLLGHVGPVNCVAFSSDGENLVSCSDDGTIRLWSKLGTSCRILSKGSRKVNSVAISRDSNFLVSSSDDGAVRLWEMKAESEPKCHQTNVTLQKLSFSSCGQFIDTDRGALDIASFSSSISHIPRTRSKSLFVAQSWLRRNTDNFMHLPYDYHGSQIAVRGELIALGNSSGGIIFMYV